MIRKTFEEILVRHTLVSALVTLLRATPSLEATFMSPHTHAPDEDLCENVKGKQQTIRTSSSEAAKM